MSFERSSRGPGGGPGPGPAASPLGPGKQTLTAQLDAAIVQQRAARAPEADVHAAAAHGTRGSATALPHRAQIQQAFGRHDVGHIQAHVGGAAAEGAAAMGATAFAVGDRVAFAGAPGATGGAVQRHAFIKGKQVLKSDKFVTASMLGFVTDDVVRDYESPAEFQNHVDHRTDYLGNLDDKDHTWLRFRPSGLNLIGEVHETEWSLKHILAAVNSKSFISEAIASEEPPAGSQLKTAYDARIADRTKELGIDKEKDKTRFGAEPLPPKLGYGMTMLLPYLNLGKGTGDGDKNVHRLTKDNKDSKGTVNNYPGELFLAMLQMSWAYANDARIAVMAMYVGGMAVPPRLDALAQVVEKVRGELGPYITGLPVHGWLGDTLADPANAKLLPPLVRFVQAVIDMLTEHAVADPGNSGLDATQQKKFAGKTTNDEKQQMFLDWRNRGLLRSVKDAAARHVRYASMGFNHIEPLVKAGLPPEVHVYEDSPGQHTQELQAIAVKQPP